VVFELPSGNTAADVVTTLGALVTLLAAGHLTPEEANAVASVIEGQRRAIETAEHEARLRALEERVGTDEQRI
jgi:hypothetical protein